MKWRLPSRSISTSTCSLKAFTTDTHAVEATGHLVALATELAAGVQHGQHDLSRRHAFVLRMFVDGDAATVVAHLSAAVGDAG